ncbi:PH domain-containing protein [Myceligenerans xiligouense]|uniref:Putative membrane protein n=1 Tax=Myceligenerans xiligouense TaxID=253184 RepID=A0A3N4Z110_9MICO|nr:PH domain-containing protein [Myceligenerans xiligouense]RPF19778.1 putative membrane protein [Myceligenerans xiligouense]
MNAPGTTPEQVPDRDAALRWRRVHPVTPMVRGWAVLGGALFIIGQQTLDGGPNEGGVVGLLTSSYWWTVPLGLVLIGLIGFGFAVLAWRMTTYAVGDETVHLRRGVVFRQQRHARLDRLQAVDVRQPLVARLFGLSELRLEVAGGSDSGIAIGYLRDADASELRNELLARAAGLKATTAPAQGPGGVPGTAGPGDPGVAETTPDVPSGAPEAPERPVLEVPMGRLVASLLRTGVTIFFAAFIVGLIVTVVVTGTPQVVFAVIAPFIGIGGYLFNRFSTEFAFRVAISADGIRLRHGLLETRAQTIPPGRVQAVSITQGLLWRGRDWWRVQVNVAGYAADSDSGTTNVLLPVGTRDEALTVLSLVLPDLGIDDPRAVLEAGLSGDSRTPGPFTGSPESAVWVDPVGWRRQGFAVTGRALLLRSGRLYRILTVVPHERTQSLGIAAGPLQRRLGVASFEVHSTPGPVSPGVHHIAAGDAAELLEEQAARARSARAHAGPERWMEAPR